MKKKNTISIVIPFLNEERNIQPMYTALMDVWQHIPAYDYEIIFVNDGSVDGSQNIVTELTKKDVDVHFIEFSRNFGKEMATTAGVHEATGDAVIMIDADLQHPPAYIPSLITKWEGGAEIVVGVRTKNTSAGLIKNIGSWGFHAIMSVIAHHESRPGETDFRLIDRVVIDAFKQLPERQRMTRTLINWLGFRRAEVPFVADTRMHGEAKYSTIKLVRLALTAFAANSLLPLRITGYLGLCITAVFGFLGAIIFLERYVFHNALGWAISGSAKLAVVNVTLIGIVLVALGLIALYIGNITHEVRGRPLYVVRTRN